jgi:hypothetical protein
MLGLLDEIKLVRSGSSDVVRVTIVSVVQFSFV